MKLSRFTSNQLCLLFIIICNLSYAQESETTDISKYLDDGAISGRMSVLVDIEAFTRNEAEVMLEKSIDNKSSIVFGIGYLGAAHRYNLIDENERPVTNKKDQGGFMASAVFRLYTNKKLDRLYYSVGTRYRNYTTFHSIDAVFEIGLKYVIGRNFLVDFGLNFGMGYLFPKVDIDPMLILGFPSNTYDRHYVNSPFNLKIGYTL